MSLNESISMAGSISEMISNNFLNIAYFNARSIPSHIDNIRFILFHYNYDIVFVTETWLKPGMPEELFSVVGYNFYHIDRKDKRAGGVGIYIKSDFMVNLLDFKNTTSIEQLWLSIKIKNQSLAVGVVYKPPDVCYSQLDCLHTIFENLSLQYDHVIITGDYNIDYLDTSKIQRRFIHNLITSYNFEQIITEPTRITNNSATLLDYLIISNKGLVSSVSQRPVSFSDHDLFQFVYHIAKNKPKPTIIKKRSYKHFNSVAFSQDAVQAGWEEVFTTDTIDNKVEIFNNILIELFNKHAPIKTFKTCRPPAPWLTDTIKKEYQKRDKLHNKYRKLLKNSNSDSLVVSAAEDKYKVAKNKCNKLTRQAKVLLFKTKINNNLNSSKHLWASLKELGVHGNSSQSVPINISASDLNNFFVSFNNASVNNVTIQNEINDVLRNCIYPSFLFQHTSINQVHKAIKSITTNSMGVDFINKRMLLECLPFCLPALTHIINFSFSSNTFPKIWKLANIQPIPKISSPSVAKDYRPISLLSTVSKVIEKIVSKQINNYLNNHNLFNTFQSGFRHMHSTGTSLLCITNQLVNDIDSGNVSILALLDFSKAFDTVNHKLLLAKLQSLGFMTSAIQWVQSYLQDRRQRVHINNNKSDWLSIANGVPQGSILGPLLFIILTHDFNSVISTSNYHMYADDSQLYTSANFENLPGAISNLNHDLLSISNWAKRNALHLNESKCTYMFIGSPHSIKKIKELHQLLVTLFSLVWTNTKI